MEALGVIYLDVLLILNLFVNYFLFLGTVCFLHRKPKRWRLILGSAIGSLFSLLIFADSINFILMTLIKLPLAALLVWIALGYGSRGLYIKTVLTFFGVNFLFGGVMLLIQLAFSPAGMLVNNGMVYFNISALMLVLGTLAAYGVIRLVGYLLDNRVRKKETCRLLIEADGRQVILDGFFDSGNKLMDPISGLPVVVCEFNSICDLIPREIQDGFRSGAAAGLSRLEQHAWASRLRLVPFQVVGHSGMLTAFFPDHFYLVSEDGVKREERRVLIGVTDSCLSQGEYQAILSSGLFRAA